MKAWRSGLVGVALLAAGCLNFDDAEASFCAKVGCSDATGTVDQPGVTVGGTPGAGATTSSTQAQLTLTPFPTSATVTGFQCQVDGAATAACQSPLNLTGLREGTHSLHVWALNAQGKAGAVTTYGWTVTPLSTTIHDIRTLPVAEGTRVSLSSPTLQLTIATTDRFWVQEATTAYSGITVQPIVFNALDTSLVHGLSMAVVGTVADVNGNTTLVDATYTTGSVQDGYDARFDGQDGLLLQSEGNEGMWVYDPGYGMNCAGYDFCLYDCDGNIIPAVNAVRQGLSLGGGRDFLGVMEGIGPTTYRLFASEEQAGSDACGP